MLIVNVKHIFTHTNTQLVITNTQSYTEFFHSYQCTATSHLMPTCVPGLASSGDAVSFNATLVLIVSTGKTSVLYMWLSCCWKNCLRKEKIVKERKMPFFFTASCHLTYLKLHLC